MTVGGAPGPDGTLVPLYVCVHPSEGDHSYSFAKDMGKEMLEAYVSTTQQAVDRLMVHLIDVLLTAQSDSTTHVQQMMLESM